MEKPNRVGWWECKDRQGRRWVYWFDGTKLCWNPDGEKCAEPYTDFIPLVEARDLEQAKGEFLSEVNQWIGVLETSERMADRAAEIFAGLPEPKPVEVLVGPCELPEGNWLIEDSGSPTYPWASRGGRVIGRGQRAMRCPEFPPPPPALPSGPVPLRFVARSESGRVEYGVNSGEQYAVLGGGSGTSLESLNKCGWTITKWLDKSEVAK